MPQTFFCLPVLATLLIASPVLTAQTLALDFQPTNGTTAEGYEAFEVTNGTGYPEEGIDYNAFGTTINVAVAAANVENDPVDHRSVTRNGDITDVRNDWIGVDGRNAAGGNPEATFTITVSGLPVGPYRWTNLLHDGGTGTAGAGQGNINGNVRTTFADATGLVEGTAVISSENPLQPTSSFVTEFTSDGSPVSLTMGTTGTGGDAIFALAASLEISRLSPLVPLQITEITFDREASPSPTVTLTWRHDDTVSYAAKYSQGLSDWSRDLDDNITPDRDENPGDSDHLTVTFPLPDGLEEEARLFFRIEKP
jgi:hypothetical protein